MFVKDSIIAWAAICHLCGKHGPWAHEQVDARRLAKALGWIEMRADENRYNKDIWDCPVCQGMTDAPALGEGEG